MTRNKKSEAEEFEALQKIGFELRAPQDEFSYQPDSSSSIGGIRGKQEYGIETDYDAEGKADQIIEASDSLSLEDKIIAEEPPPASEDEHLTDDELQALLEKRLADHPHLQSTNIDVIVRKSKVTVFGEVPKYSAKLLIDEMVEAMPGVTEIKNNVKVVQASAAQQKITANNGR
jgi:osmotically-inducible protein OsmY